MLFEVCSWPQFDCRNVDHGIQVGGILFPRDEHLVNVFTMRTCTMTKTIVRAQPILLAGETTASDSVWRNHGNVHGTVTAPQSPNRKRLGATHPRA